MTNLKELAAETERRQQAIQAAADLIKILSDPDSDDLDEAEQLLELGHHLPMVHDDLLQAACYDSVYDPNPDLCAMAAKAIGELPEIPVTSA